MAFNNMTDREKHCEFIINYLKTNNINYEFNKDLYQITLKNKQIIFLFKECDCTIFTKYEEMTYFYDNWTEKYDNDLDNIVKLE